MKNKRLDDTTFGDSKAEITLARILSDIDNPVLTKYVGRILVTSDELVRDLTKSNMRLKSFVFNILRTHFLEKVDKSKVVSRYPEVSTYFKNAISKRFKPRKSLNK